MEKSLEILSLQHQSAKGEGKIDLSSFESLFSKKYYIGSFFEF